ncbi:aminoglycoside phosphotransferase family protein [Sutterella sp.]|uniref:aminoglycoside phosphotransferase family protein n=1 Tax=Sutterella sp. TaxID=1981025 RepID=UPI0026DF80A0|nr:phosphotransferase [Sutterella sp.]MDO5531019.1 phosphotransferase [Sutterella sp.]
MTDRDSALHAWLEKEQPRLGFDLDSMAPASSDAGFRRYFRVTCPGGGTLIVMDAPPATENLPAFLRIDRLMADAGLNVPVIHAADEEQGFAIISDLGRETFLNVINEENAARLMDAATTALVKWQLASRPGVLPPYDRAVLLREMNLFPEWYVGRHLGVTWDAKREEWWKMTTDAIIEVNLADPTVFVHRDFMPRNLMMSDPLPGVIDFQDALMGPITYDIASLLRDAFVSWSESFVLDITIRYWEKARKAGLPVPEDFGSFWRSVEFMGLQRHLKVLGIFARINYRDGKPKYLADTPRFMAYARQTAGRYRELSPLRHLLDELEGVQEKAGYTF